MTANPPFIIPCNLVTVPARGAANAKFNDVLSDIVVPAYVVLGVDADPYPTKPPDNAFVNRLTNLSDVCPLANAMIDAGPVGPVGPVCPVAPKIPSTPVGP